MHNTPIARNKRDECHAGTDKHLLTAELVGNMAHAEHHEDVSDQADGGDGAGLGSPRIPWGCADPICTITRMGVWANTWSNSR